MADLSYMSTKYDLERASPNRLHRPELACDNDWIAAFLARTQVGQVATRWDEQPFITPTVFWYDPEQHEIYFHSAPEGRLRSNIERHEQVCFAASQTGRLLPSNVALEFSIQYESVVVFGRARLLRRLEDKRRALSGLIAKYFPDMSAGEHYRPITDPEVKRTAVYGIEIDSWSGKRNWPARAEQSPDWPQLFQPLT
jgi:nitroimidazol reductase NimA-like FMN-containing flavoprotein (pyridoxamine 5'-phosphate oxidase superfamily)